MPKNTKYARSLRDYATQYNVSLSTIKRWSSADVDLDDKSATLAHAMSQKNAPPNLRMKPSAEDQADTFTAILQRDRRAINWLVGFAQSGESLGAGETPEQIKTGNLNIADHIVLRFWKSMVLAHYGNNIEAIERILNEEGQSNDH